MTRKKRDLFRELSAGIRTMRDHAEGRVELRMTLDHTRSASTSAWSAGGW